MSFETRGSVGTFPRSFLHSDDYDRPGAEILLDAPAPPPTTLTPPPLRLVRLNFLPTFSPSPVEGDLDLLVPGEIPSQILIEARLIGGDDDHVSGQAWGHTVGNPGAVRSSEWPPFGERPSLNGLEGVPGE